MESPRPSVVGRPRGAGVSVRVPSPVRQPDSWGEAARSFRRGADDLAQLARMGASLAAQEQAKEDQARFKDLYNRAMEETTRRLQQEVYTKKGFDAADSIRTSDSIISEVSGKYVGQLTGEGRAAFLNSYNANRASWARSAITHENSQLSAAEDAADAQAIADSTSLYASDPNSFAPLDAALERADERFSRRYGRRVDDALLAEFDQDLKDGKLKRSGGGTLRVTDVSDGKPDSITRQQAVAIRDRLAKAAEARNAYRRQILDEAHRKAVDNYLAANNLAGAEAYLLRAESDPDHPVGPQMRKAIADTLARHREVSEVSLAANAAASEIAAVGGLYGDEKQQKAYADARAALMKKYASNPEKQRKMLSALELNYRILEEQQKARLQADVQGAMKLFQQSGFYSLAGLPQMKSVIDAMPDDRRKTALTQAYDRVRRSFDESDDPALMMEQMGRMTALRLAITRGEPVTLDGVTYQVQDEKQRNALILNSGLTAKRQKQLVEWLDDRKNSVTVDALLRSIDNVANKGIKDPDDRIAPEDALMRYPGLMEEVMKELATEPDAKIDQGRIDGIVGSLLMRRYMQPGTVWGFNDKTALEILRSGDEVIDRLGVSPEEIKRRSVREAVRSGASPDDVRRSPGEFLYAPGMEINPATGNYERIGTFKTQEELDAERRAKREKALVSRPDIEPRLLPPVDMNPVMPPFVY